MTSFRSEHARDWVVAQAMLLGFVVSKTSRPDTPGFRWNSGTAFGRWAPSKTTAAVEFLSSRGFLVDVDGDLHRI